MHRTNIYLDDEQLSALRMFAAAQGTSVATVVRTAVDDYLRAHFDRDALLAMLDDTVARIRSNVPIDIAPEEKEQDITAAYAEMKAARRASRRR